MFSIVFGCRHFCQDAVFGVRIVFHPGKHTSYQCHPSDKPHTHTHKKVSDYHIFMDRIWAVSPAKYLSITLQQDLSLEHTCIQNNASCEGAYRKINATHKRDGIYIYIYIVMPFHTLEYNVQISAPYGIPTPDRTLTGQRLSWDEQLNVINWSTPTVCGRWWTISSGPPSSPTQQKSYHIFHAIQNHPPSSPCW